MEDNDFRSKEIIENEELILLILYYSENYYTLKTRLIKLLFVFEKIFPINEESDLNLDFFPYNYGPTIDYDEYELLISTLKNYNFIKVEEKWIEQYSSHIFKIKLQEKDKNGIIRMIKEKLIPEKPKYKIELIERICNLFPNQENNVLNQFVYYIREDFTENSIIKHKIFNLPKKKLQNKVINIFKELRVRYLNVFLDNTDPILKIFNVTKTNADYTIFKELFSRLQLGIKNNRFIIIEDLIQNIDKMSLKDKKFHNLKLSILDLFLKNLNNKWDNEITISVLIYLLKSLSLDWPLENSSDRKIFVTLSSQLFQNYNSFYTPEDSFKILQKTSATEQEIQRFILEYEKDLTLKRGKNKEDIEYGEDFTEDDEKEDDISQEVNL